MPYPPPIPLPVPSALAPLPEACVGLTLDSLGLMTAEEQQSNQQLHHCVRTPRPAVVLGAMQCIVAFPQQAFLTMHVVS